MTGDEPATDTDVAATSGSGQDSVAAAEPGAMRARTWSLAASFRDPADYGIPSLPEWTVYHGDGGAMALGPEDGDGVFIAADDPVPVRR
ncbi:hypothetical protein [Haloglomus litoreum]|uniref:hypothetical protein n=1 Tax=Haloglomus litoreum TaxID=3034026 RepID=UPI0023E7A9CF|nr:hypothetical protein [Haloglomus sp. DT116]